MAIIPLDRRKAADIVHDRMRDMILTKRWKAGTRIPSEAALCEMFGVSRVTVREATHRLAGQGILSVRQGDGTYVEELSPASMMRGILPLMVADAASMEQALSFRALLEIEAARLAALHHQPHHTELLRQVLEEERKGGHTFEENALLDQLFHETVAKAAGNPLIEACITLVNDIIARGSESAFGRMTAEDALLYHWMILDAIAQGRADAAAGAQRAHSERMLQSP
jgi:GntR family transcriptional repressor for pyruvate dehydrogenase complex